MKTAIITPFLSAALMGYQNTFRACIESQAEFADYVYLIQSADDRRGLEMLPDNVRVVSWTPTWFRNGAHSYDRMTRNIALGCALAILDGCDAAIMLACNTYVPQYAVVGLRGRVAKMLEGGGPFDYIYRANLIAGHLAYPSKRLPNMMNLEYFPVVHRRDMPDALFCDGNSYGDEYGEYLDKEDEAAVDAPLEITLEEYEAKMNFVKCHSVAMPKRNPVFVWDFWRDYMARKVSLMIESAHPLDEYGQRIASATRPEYVGAEIWRLAHGVER